MPYQKPFVPRTPTKRQAEIKKLFESKGVKLTPCSHCHHDKIEIFEVSIRLNVRTDLQKAS